MSAVSSRRNKQGKIDPLEKKVPQNPRYKNVKATIDTGASVSRYMRKIEDIRQNYRFRPDEIFKRMKISTFVQLTVQVYRISEHDAYDQIPPTPAGDGRNLAAESEEPELQRLQGISESPVPSLVVTEGDFGATPTGRDTSRSTLLSVARGVGEMDLNKPEDIPANQMPDDMCPYLLLDVRDRDEFESCHIITAKSYPKANLSKATNYESKDMLLYKNKPGKIIVIYDEDERVAPHCGTTLVQRGYDNLFMLSGGLKVASRVFPEGLIWGTLPVSLGGKPTKEPITSTQRNFTAEDMDKIEIYLNNSLQDNSIGSRLSKASTTSSRLTQRSTARSSTSVTSKGDVKDRPPFR